jgi:hypothetical protein
MHSTCRLKTDRYLLRPLHAYLFCTYLIKIQELVLNSNGGVSNAMHYESLRSAFSVTAAATAAAKRQSTYRLFAYPVLVALHLLITRQVRWSGMHMFFFNDDGGKREPRHIPWMPWQFNNRRDFSLRVSAARLPRHGFCFG